MNTRSMNNKNIVNTNNSSSQKDGFINNIRNLLVLNQNSQIPTYEGLKVRMQTIIDTAKTIYRNLANVLPEIENHISAGKLISTMYLKIHEMMIESKNAHIREYIVKEKKILKIRKIALKVERKCRKCLFILYDLIQSTKILIIPNYEKIETLHNELENMYSLRPRSAIYYGEEDGNFDDPTDADYNPSDDEEEYDEEEFEFDQDDDELEFDEDDNDSEYDPSDDEENDDEEFDFDEADEEEDEDDDSDYDYEDEDEYSTEDAEFMDEYNNDPEYLLDEDQDDDKEEFDFDEVDDNDSEYTPSEADEDDEEYNFDEEDDNDSDYTPSEADEDEEEFDFDEEDEEDEDEDEEYEEHADEDDKQFVSDYLNDPDYNPDEDEDEEDELEYDFSFLNKKIDEDGNIVLKAGIADDNDEEDPDYDPTDDEDDEDDEEDIKYVNNKNILNICKRRFENGKVVYRWVKMTKEQAEKKYDEDYDCEEN